MACKRAAEGVHRFECRIHDVDPGPSMDMRIDESRNNSEAERIDSFGRFRYANVGEQTSGFESAISNHHAARGELISGTQNRAGVDDENPITHARCPDVRLPCGDCRRLQ